MIDLNFWIIYELLFLRMKLNSVKWKFIGLHGCHENLTLVIVAQGSWPEHGLQAFVSFKLIWSNAIMMMVVGQILCREGL